MKRILLFTVAGLLLFLFSAPRASAFGVKDVLQMSGDGIADSLIILKIQNSGTTFHLSGNDMHALHEAGVSNEVISTMLRTEGRDRGQDYDNYGDYYPYPYAYPNAYPYTHVYLGFGFHRNYYSPYYGGYRYPRYRPYYSNPYYGNYGSYGSYRNHGSYGNYRYRGSYGSRQPAVGGSGTRYRPR